MLCRQLLTCLHPAVLTLQQIFQRLNFPREPGPVNIKLFLAVCRRFQLLFLPSQAVCSSHPQQYHAYWSALWILPINLQLTYHPSSGKALWIPLLPHIKGSSSSMASWPVLPKKPLSIHCNTPVMQAIPSHLHHSHKIIALQLHTQLKILMFIPLTYISIQTFWRNTRTWWFPRKCLVASLRGTLALFTCWCLQ